MNIPRETRSVGLVVLCLGAVAACGGDGGTDPEPGEPVLTAVSGTGQTGTAGAPVADPLVVRITQDGSPVAGRTVTWNVTAGGGSVDPATSSTASDGRASTTWTLGPSVGAQSAEATASGVVGAAAFVATAEEVVAPPLNAAVSVVDNAFDPGGVTIATGGAVTWQWAGTLGHNVTFASGPNSVTQTEGSFSRTFGEAGQFDYQCTIHGSSMSGTVTVVDAS